MENFELELKEDFLIEALELMAEAEASFLRLESDRANLSLLDEIFRLAHNLKGTSKAVGFEQLADITHVAENVLTKLKNRELQVTDGTISVLLEFKDKVSEIIEGLKGNFDATFVVDSTIERLELASKAGNKELNPICESSPILNNEPAVSEVALESLREYGLVDEAAMKELESCRSEKK
ncbi:MAG: hypothetical protein HOE90_22435 [Bacteriovoracaceae bacterium]|jgi:chemotaxis protein histidine kinase CheA|nr:hypothetical protein [Bacteriovoracaceae bacterium]